MWPSGHGICPVLKFSNILHIVQTSDYFLFGLLKKELKGKRFDSDEDVQKVVQDSFHTLPKSAYKEGIYKLPERWRRCIESQGLFGFLVAGYPDGQS
ncbi:hypothetical protein LAZ67_6002649 [Cordylochernes scorpioides]|uniref:Uncharacterized protein n=1 Tax=Cordylochernes scorpioides TaxID=51811 RepID=A0ABY6KKM2_9ARAC|nr:hypothetical protein LAZ67_6002649 [Cordylochernes scorpioides]